MPPKKKPIKKIARRAQKKTEAVKEDKFLQVVSLLLVIGVVFNWAGFSGIVGTVAYLNDTESSQGNSFVGKKERRAQNKSATRPCREFI